jgi:hypothetical protein
VGQEYDDLVLQASNRFLAAGALRLPRWRVGRSDTGGILQKMICQLVQTVTKVSTFKKQILQIGIKNKLPRLSSLRVGRYKSMIDLHASGILTLAGICDLHRRNLSSQFFKLRL